MTPKEFTPAYPLILRLNNILFVESHKPDLPSNFYAGVILTELQCLQFSVCSPGIRSNSRWESSDHEKIILQGRCGDWLSLSFENGTNLSRIFSFYNCLLKLANWLTLLNLSYQRSFHGHNHYLQI